MTDQEPLLEAIRAQPQDDTVRLVYADWLDEYGNAKDRKWATMIRHEVALAGVPHNHKPGKNGPCPRCVLDKEDRKFVGWANWNIVPPTLDGRCVFSRGFVRLVIAPAAVWVKTFNWSRDALPGWMAAWETRSIRPIVAKPILILTGASHCHGPSLGNSLYGFNDVHILDAGSQQQFILDHAPHGRYATDDAEVGVIRFYSTGPGGFAWTLNNIIGRDWQGRLVRSSNWDTPAHSGIIPNPPET
jgi:uncharacterized protein (TIGR02996 family)